MIARLSRTLPVVSLLALGACARAGGARIAPSPAPESRYVSSATGRDVGLEGVLQRAAGADVVFLGEQHDDPATHRVELSILAALGSGARPVVLSLEMFERDVQRVLDDYLAGKISEGEFLAKSRPWERYTTDYRGMVELARARGWTVVASNVPRRHATAVSRKGLAAIDSLPAAERGQVARELICPRNDDYYTRFADTMKGHSAGGGPPTAADSAMMRSMTDRFYEAQCVKDETMAESIVAALAAAPKDALVFHVDGAFHSDYGLGTAARVRRRNPGARVLVLSAVPVDTVAQANAAPFAKRGDIVILTRKAPAAPPSPAAPAK
ncbi:MAG: ChaN family lipoprotein [Gemmatimonadaceae bacterium]|nr:ChaN family lipoprotein [Gemmatimonadaceae bacterium]